MSAEKNQMEGEESERGEAKNLATYRLTPIQKEKIELLVNDGRYTTKAECVRALIDLGIAALENGTFGLKPGR
jgi:hypothetical protein